MKFSKVELKKSEFSMAETEAIPKFEYWLNGLTGIVTSFDPSSGLYTILLSDYIGTAVPRAADGSPSAPEHPQHGLAHSNRV